VPGHALELRKHVDGLLDGAGCVGELICVDGLGDSGVPV
jgi:hypothetical protein